MKKNIIGLDANKAKKLAEKKGYTESQKQRRENIRERLIESRKQKLSFEIPEIIDDIKLNRKRPLLVEIPDRHGSGRQPNFITNYINEAIGIKL